MRPKTWRPPRHAEFNLPGNDIEVALVELFKFFDRLIPVDVLDFPIYDRSNGTLYYTAFVTREGAILVNGAVQLTLQGMQEMEGYGNQDLTLFSNSLDSPVLQEIVPHYPFPQPFSAFSVPLDDLRQRKIRGVSSVVIGKNRYDQSHVDAMRSNLNQIAWQARYIYSSMEVLDLKDRLATQHQEILRRLGVLAEQQIIGSETGLSAVMNLVRKVARMNSPVLLTGETGVGKEVIANAIHRMSRTAKGPMVSVNCGAIPETLLDSELFGHEKGAFTGASTMKRGYFEQADGGSIFLDEIGELSLSAQIRLLRMLQTSQFQRVGGSHQISSQVRVIAATNRDLQAMVKSDLFRKDLWFRINVFPIHVPPLRERREDIPALAEYLAHRKAHEMALEWSPSFAEGAMEQLQAYDWPGNVRELQNVIERALIIFANSPMSFSNLKSIAEPAEAKHPSLALQDVMAMHIVKCLKLAKGRIEGAGGAAELLDIHPSTLRSKMRRLGIPFRGYDTN